MDAEKLENYRALADEIKDLEQKQKQLASLTEEVNDAVRGSSASWPYTAHTIQISGASEKHQAAIRRVEKLRQERLLEAQERLAEIEAYLSGIQDLKVRRMISLRYVDGLSWRQVARRMYGSPGFDEAARKRVKRFLEKNP